MKIVFLSDIHGSIKFLNKAMYRFIEEKADKLVLLGDLIEGPSHLKDYFYNPQEVADLLNEYKDKIIAVKGNCDGEYDQAMFDFSILEKFSMIDLGERKIFASHGHQYNSDNMPVLNKGDIFIHGHLHVPIVEVLDGVYYFNTGSVSLPRQGSRNSYGVLDNNKFLIKDLDGTIIMEIDIL